MFIDIHTHKREELQKNISIFSKRAPFEVIEAKKEGCLYSAGVHPWDVSKLSYCKEELFELLKGYKNDILAVGEIGLDGLHPEFEKQIEFFEWQIEFATENNLAIVVHTVKSFDKTYQKLKFWHKKLKAIIIHSFVGNEAQAKQLLSLGCYLSLSEISLNSTKTVRAIKFIPLESIFIESDDSKSDIEEIYKKVAQIKEVDIKLLEETVEKNFSVVQ